MTNYKEKIINLALNEIGYLEKKTNNYLYDKIANIGHNDYTKYSKDLDEINNFYLDKRNGKVWCVQFIDWLFIKAFGLEEAKKITFHTPLGSEGKYAALSYQMHNRWYNYPLVGDEIFIKTKKGNYTHTGLVVDIKEDYLYVIEGNTYGPYGVYNQIEGVAKKPYWIKDPKINGYGRPLYDNINRPSSLSEKQYNIYLSSQLITSNKNNLEIKYLNQLTDLIEKKLNKYSEFQVYNNKNYNLQNRIINSNNWISNFHLTFQNNNKNKIFIKKNNIGAQKFSQILINLLNSTTKNKYSIIETLWLSEVANISINGIIFGINILNEDLEKIANSVIKSLCEFYNIKQLN